MKIDYYFLLGYYLCVLSHFIERPSVVLFISLMLFVLMYYTILFF